MKRGTLQSSYIPCGGPLRNCHLLYSYRVVFFSVHGDSATATAIPAAAAAAAAVLPQLLVGGASLRGPLRVLQVEEDELLDEPGYQV